MNTLSRLTLMGLVASTSVWAQDTAKPATPAENKENNKTTSAPPAESNTDYKIGPQDVLRVDVWKEPDISRSVCLEAARAATLSEENLVAVIPAGRIIRATRKSLTANSASPRATIFLATFSSSRMFPGQ